eukprot:TRINITY_DN1560_c0_g1_i1.p1 TRINITY_DN1560_c0_g1~~TRINITY_DN1560_c0_g1_i1.p1  ORF type:complete len:317 (-),score=64.08 TRINITY_DN1560_c0_g1_i1:13-831(-)
MEETARLCRAARSGVAVSCHVVDVGNKDRVNAFAQEVAVQYDGVVDMLFNNAGVAGGGPFDQLSEETFDWVVSINLYGVIHCTRAFLPLMKGVKEGYLINTSSAAGIYASKGNTAYCLSKFGVRGFTESLMMEFAVKYPNIHVAVVHPGIVSTGIFRAARFEGSQADVDQTRRTVEELAKNLGTTSADAAKQILEGVRRNQSRIFVGGDAWFLDLAVRAFPRLAIHPRVSPLVLGISTICNVVLRRRVLTILALLVLAHSLAFGRLRRTLLS